ncbi:MAG TPA: TIGR04282 family arsenosugar biosynthesis glycosyltransferase [Opitutales bacterium]|nr:TIGR04282 family arsenosugar biosynthesis glycosyltransferase [Opitutales bacterium]
MNSPQDSSTRILLFLKAPVEGTVKTRLAASIGEEKATEIYRTLGASQLLRLPKGIPLEIHYSPREQEAEMRQWLGTELSYYPQCEGNLGDRIEHAVSEAFRRGAGTVFCIGADCPSLLPHHLDQAASILLSGQGDVCIGPCPDGGYYLIGFRKQPPGPFFKGIRWSSQHTMADTLRNARTHELGIHCLETMNDVDTREDLADAVKQGFLPPSCLPPESLTTPQSIQQ